MTSDSTRHQRRGWRAGRVARQGPRAWATRQAQRTDLTAAKHTAERPAGRRWRHSALAAARRAPVLLLLAVGMLLLGSLVGVAFPAFVAALGVPGQYVHTPLFRTACLTAGLLLAGANWCLVRCIVGRRLRRLSTGLAMVAHHMMLDSTTGAPLSTRPALDKLPTGARDDLGAAARAFNELLDALDRERRFRTVIHANRDVTVMVDNSGVVVFASSSVQQVLGWDPTGIVGAQIQDAVHPDDRHLLQQLLTTPAGGTAHGSEQPPYPTARHQGDACRTGDDSALSTPVVVTVATSDGHWRSLELSFSDHRNDAAIAALVLTGRDVTDRVRLQRELSHQAVHDVLTGLPNRAALLRRAGQLQASPRQTPLAVALMDLDRFKEINDTLGHDYGDKLLAEVGPRLQQQTRPDDLLVRLGADEFAILMIDVTVEGALSVAKRARAALQQPFEIDGLLMEIDASVGVATTQITRTASARPTHQAGGTPSPADLPDALATSVAEPGRPDRVDVHELLRMADVAMYTAKELQTGVEHYDPRTDGNDRSRLTLLTDLRRALADGGLLLHYQPKLDLRTGTLAGVEALVRWQHPTRGLLPPGAFLPAVEHTGLIWPLTLEVLDQALRQIRAWQQQGHDIPVAVNLSARCLHRSDLADHVLARLRNHDVPAALLRLELTESALMAEPDLALQQLQQLADAGVRLSIDDFGTGYSSMSYLSRLPVDELKVDRSFVTNIGSQDDDDVLIRSIVELGHSLGLTVVAEGVETAGVHTNLQNLACDTGQGYYYARPQAAADLEPWLATPTKYRRPATPSPSSVGHRTAAGTCAPTPTPHDHARPSVPGPVPEPPTSS